MGLDVTDVDVRVVVCTVACDDGLLVEITAFDVDGLVGDVLATDAFVIDGVVTADVGLTEVTFVVVAFEVAFEVVFAVVLTVLAAVVVFLTVLAAVVAAV